MTKISTLRVLLGLACAWPLSMYAQTLPPHEHGQARLDLAQEGGTLMLALDMPADDLLGFEHPPATEAEKSKLKEVLAALDDYHTVVRLLGEDGELECEQQRSEVESPLLDAAPAAAETHSDFDVTYQLTCVGAPRGVVAALIDNYPGVAVLHLQWVLDAAQGGAALTPSEPQVRF
jgi:hypothetical protein